MNLLNQTFRRGGKEATLYYAPVAPELHPKGRSADEYCAHCGGLFGTIFSDRAEFSLRHVATTSALGPSWSSAARQT